MKKTFRQHHLLQVLETFDLESLPLDVHLHYYFRNHKALGSKDRKFISESIYQLIRWQGLIDHFCSNSHGWEERLLMFNQLNFKKALCNPSIPMHIRMSFPKIFFDLLHVHFGEKQTQQLCLASNSQAPTTLRVNILKTSREHLYTMLKDRCSLRLTKVSSWGLEVCERINFHTLQEFKDGLFEVQDEGSQLVANLVDPRPGDLVLDYCAGAGGKTLAFAHKLRGKGQLYLHDIRKRPLENAKKRLKRAGVENAQIFLANSPHLEALQGKMDWVLVDIPCSGSGTLRRNPDMKWKFSKELLERLVLEQREIFKKALLFLKKSGKIVYATCSILPQENEEQIDFFLRELSLELVTSPFQSFPTEGGMDGFFGAVLRKVDH